VLTYSRKFSPFSKYLKLHNGALLADDDPMAERKPVLCKRDRKSTVARHNAQKQAEEIATAAVLEELRDEDCTPRKKVCCPDIVRTRVRTHHAMQPKRIV
jgi:hypothetical protein